jgi:hypothetical protein
MKRSPAHRGASPTAIESDESDDQEKRDRRIIGYRDLAKLVIAIERHRPRRQPRPRAPRRLTGGPVY